MKIRNYFIRHEDGSWEPLQPFTITGPNGKIQISPGVRFKPGVPFIGLDIAQLCEDDADV
jgi:hypothetical protein